MNENINNNIACRTNTHNSITPKRINTVEFDFIDIEKRLKDLKELERKLISELESF